MQPTSLLFALLTSIPFAAAQGSRDAGVTTTIHTPGGGTTINISDPGETYIGQNGGQDGPSRRGGLTLTGNGNSFYVSGDQTYINGTPQRTQAPATGAGVSASATTTSSRSSAPSQTGTGSSNTSGGISTINSMTTFASTSTSNGQGASTSATASSTSQSGNAAAPMVTIAPALMGAMAGIAAFAL